MTTERTEFMGRQVWALGRNKGKDRFRPDSFLPKGTEETPGDEAQGRRIKGSPDQGGRQKGGGGPSPPADGAAQIVKAWNAAPLLKE